jgi:pteridine reductase
VSVSTLEGKTALVTGAARRVGRAIALALARAGAEVLVHYHTSRDEADKTVAAIETLGRRATALPADLTRPAEIDGLVEAVRRTAVRLDVLVNSAAAYERSPLAGITPERWDAMLDLNLRAPFLLSRAAAPLLRENGGGVIVNIADVAGRRAWPHHLHYAVSKAGLIAMTRCLALELAPEIRVNAVAPGTVLPATGQSPGDLAAILDRTPLGRFATPEEIGEAVAFLAGGPGSITGEILTVDGGRSINSTG